MDRTNTTSLTSFTLPPPATATFSFPAPHQIRITIPPTSTWTTPLHFHSRDRENCLLLHPEKGELHISYYKEPRRGADKLGPGDFEFKPSYWTFWQNKPRFKKPNEEAVVVLLVRDEGLYRNMCGAVLDAERYPFLKTTPLWVRVLFAVLEALPRVRRRVVEGCLYVQLQAIYTACGYWEYHGGVNAEPEAFVEDRAGGYYWVARLLLGMRADYVEYNPNFGRDGGEEEIESWEDENVGYGAAASKAE